MSGVVYAFIRTNTTDDVSTPVVASSQSQFNRDVSGAIYASNGGYGNAADLMFRASGVAVSNFLLCDGSAISRTAYTQLFDAIGVAWGVGDGSTTFNLPSQAGIAALIATPPTVPAQTVDDGSVSSGTTVTNPTGAGQAGGTTGGAVDSGGRTVIEP